MAIELATAYISVLPSTSKLAPAIRKELDVVERDTTQRSKRMGARLKKALLVGAGAAAGLGAAFKVIGGNASDLNESINAVDVTFGRQAAGVKRLGTEAARSLGLSNTEFNGLAVRFSSFAKTISGGGRATVGTLDEMTTRAADFASVMNLDVSEAANLFQSGLAGESEPLRRFGIDLSAAAVQAFAYSEGIAGSGKTLTEQEKVQARYGLLMKQTAKTQDDFANTSDSVANQSRILKSVFTDLTAKIGTGLLPIVQNLGTFVLDKAIPAVESFIGQWQDMSGTAGRVRGALEGLLSATTAVVGFMVRWRAVLLPIAGVVLTIAAAVKVYRGAMSAWASITGRAAAIKAAWLKVMTASRVAWLRSTAAAVAHRAVTLASTAAQKAHAAAMAAAAWGRQAKLIAAAKVQLVAHRAVTLASTAATKVAAAGQWLLNAALSANPVGLVVAVLAGLVAAVVVAYKRSDTFRRVVDAAWRGIKQAVSVVWNSVLKPIFTAYVTYVQTMMRVVGWLWTKAIRPAFAGIGTIIRNTWRNVIKPVFDTLKRVITDTLPGAFRRGVDAIGRLWDNLKRLAAKPANFIIGTVYNNGLRKLFNLLPGVPDLPAVNTVKFATGGRVQGPGSETSDSILARLSRNEFVVRASAAKRHAKLLDYINNGGHVMGFANGGRVWPTGDRTPTTYPGHDGLDFGMPMGSPIRAAAAGTISYVGWGRGYGQAIFERGPYGELVYGHTSRTAVRVGQSVRAGQYIGAVGSTGNSTGPHLHFGFPGGTFAQALAFLRGAAVGREDGRDGRGLFGRLAEVVRTAKRIWDGVRGMGGSEWGGLLKDAMGNVLGNVKGWINDKVPGPGPIPGGIFDSGGVLEPGGVAINTSRKPEAVFNHAQFRQFADGNSAATASRRVELRITNWEKGRGYMREIADSASADRQEFAGMVGRMGR